MVMVSVEPTIYALPASAKVLLLPSGKENEEPSRESAPSQAAELPKARQRKSKMEKETGRPSKGRQRVCVPVEPETYQQVVSDKKVFRQFLDRLITDYPSLFPDSIKAGYRLDGFVAASKWLWLIRLILICPVPISPLTRMTILTRL